MATFVAITLTVVLGITAMGAVPRGMQLVALFAIIVALSVALHFVAP